MINQVVVFAVANTVEGQMILAKLLKTASRDWELYRPPTGLLEGPCYTPKVQAAYFPKPRILPPRQ